MSFLSAPHVVPEFRDGLSMFKATLGAHADRALIRYFDAVLTFREVDELSDRLAAVLQRHGFGESDRFAVMAQNIPHTVICVLAAWKARGSIVIINPTLGPSERDDLLADAAPSALAVEEGLSGPWTDIPGLRLGAISLCPHDWQTIDDGRVLPGCVREHSDATDFAELVAEPVAPLAWSPPLPASPAALSYTSGTTGTPKGAVVRHESAAFVSQVYRDWLPLNASDGIVGVSPFSSIIGLAAVMGPAFLTGCAIDISYRFERRVLIDMIRRTRPTFLLGVPTLYTSMLADDELTADDFASLRHLYCGAAPTTPAIVRRWTERFGKSLRTIYGMTEVSGPAVIAPAAVEIPVDPETGALSIGVPVFNTESRIVAPDGDVNDVLPDGDIGELLVRGPQTIREYWRNPGATAATVQDGWVRTGDLALRHDGWLFLVDRIKEIIITSGMNVSPTQVEDCLQTHLDVQEVAVIGMPDEYRGEQVTAFVVARAGRSVGETELIEHCRERLAHYKCPRQVRIVDSLPKNSNGKVLRRALRDEIMQSP